MHNEIRSILETVSFGGRPVPFACQKYEGKSPLYAVYSILAETPRVCADDLPEDSVVEIDVDVYAKSLDAFSGTIGSVKKQFIAAGWTWCEDSPEIFENETGIIHRAITFEKERMILKNGTHRSERFILFYHHP